MWLSADVGHGINLVRQMQNVSSPTTKVIWVVIVAVVVVLTTGRNLEVVVMKKLSSEERGSERPSYAVAKKRSADACPDPLGMSLDQAPEIVDSASH